MIWKFFFPIARRLERLNANPVVLQRRGVSFIYYGVFSGLGGFLGLMTIFLYLAARGYSLAPATAALFLLMPLFVCVFSRVGHLFVLGRKFFTNPKKYLLETGLYNQGGIVGVVLFAVWLCLMLPVPFSVLVDGMAYGSTIGLAVGRLGCYNYGCCWGHRAPDGLGVRYHNQQSQVLRRRPELAGCPLYPVQLMMSAYNLFLFFLCSAIAFVGLPNGILAATFLFLHQGFRVWLERYRDDQNFDEGRNWKTVRIALSFMLVPAVVLVLDGQGWLNYLGTHSADFFPAQVLDTFTDPYIWGITTVAAGLLTLLYGVHGKTLGSWQRS